MRALPEPSRGRPRVGGRQPAQEGPVSGPHLAVIGGHGVKVAVAAVVPAARPHRLKRRSLHWRPEGEDVGQVMVEHLTEVLEVPADGGDLGGPVASRPHRG